MAKHVLVNYWVEPGSVIVAVPDDLDPNDYDDWFDVINSRADVYHSCEEVKLPAGLTPDWDLTDV